MAFYFGNFGLQHIPNSTKFKLPPKIGVYHLTVCVFFQTVIEAASGAGVAAAMSEKMTGLDPAIQNVGVILCGGNVDINNLPWYS